MQQKRQQVIDQVRAVLNDWREIETVSLLDFGEDIYDPYFFLSLDVFYKEFLPEPEERAEAFSFAEHFESNLGRGKDRLLIDEIPIRLEYKRAADVTETVNTALHTPGELSEPGTYLFHRLCESRTLIERSDWLSKLRHALEKELPEEFWQFQRSALQLKMEHYLSDLMASVLMDDELFYFVSAAGFIRSLCSVLFAVNHTFEPSGRFLGEKTAELPILPESFAGLFDTFLREDATISRHKRREVAELLARGVISL
ncbi:MAG: hypothetical protein ACLFPW_14290 [Spirochaetaceae bacterium]